MLSSASKPALLSPSSASFWARANWLYTFSRSAGTRVVFCFSAAYTVAKFTPGSTLNALGVTTLALIATVHNMLSFNSLVVSFNFIIASRSLFTYLIELTINLERNFILHTGYFNSFAINNARFIFKLKGRIHRCSVKQ